MKKIVTLLKSFKVLTDLQQMTKTYFWQIFLLDVTFGEYDNEVHYLGMPQYEL